MRNLSEQNQSQLNQYQPSTLRHLMSQKRLQSTRQSLKESQVRVGNYKFSMNEVLGIGYSSKVYKGVQIGNQNKKYAIKAVDLKNFRRQKLRVLETEIQIHMSLCHDNILKCYDVIKTPSHYFIVLEYCPHGSLMEYIQQKKKIGEKMAIQIMDQIFTAYKYLLGEGIIHRDIKPANILRIGNKWKIADFGFAVKTKFAFKDRVNVGTPLYMPLETLTQNYYSFKTDLFALGIILYQMVTGRTPWKCITEEELIQKMKNQAINLNEIKSNIVKLFVKRCCNLQQSQRFTPHQFKEFQFKSLECSSNESNHPKETLKSYLSLGNLRSNTKSFRSSEATEQSSQNFVEEYEKENSQILRNWFQFCRMLYCMVVNIESFLLDAKCKEVFMLTIYKYLLKSIKLLENKKINNFHLKSWDSFKTSKAYQNMHLQFTQFSVKYKKGYSDYVQNVDIDSIRTVNRKYPELALSSPLSKSFYEEMYQFIQQIAKLQNHEISLIYSSSLFNYEDKIQALDNLYQFCKVIDFKKTQLLNPEFAGTLSMKQIKITENYQYTTYSYLC